VSRITGAELASVQRAVEDYFDKTAHVFEPAEARSSSGGTTWTYPATPTRTSPCQIAPMSQQIESQFADRLGGRQGFVISLRSSTRVSTKARVRVDGRTYEVVGNDLGRSYQMRQRIPTTELT